MPDSTKSIAAREKIIQAVIRRLGSERSEPGDAHFDDELDYCDDMIAEGAKELTEALDAG